MTLHQHPLSDAHSGASPTLRSRRSWNWLAIARIIWIVLAFLLLIIFLANIPAYYQSLNSFCTQPSPFQCQTGQLTFGNVQALGQLQLSVTAIAGLLATFSLMVSILYWVVGLFIFWRKSGEWMGLIFSLVCILLGAINIFGFPVTQTPQPVLFVTNFTENVLVPPVLDVFALTFPTGRFTPRWTWSVFALLLFSSLLFPSSVSILLVIPLVVGVQIYRYVRVYDTVQRQQTKWFVFGFGASFAFLGIYNVLPLFVPALSASDSLYQLFDVLLWPMVWTMLLLSVSIAIFRYRLWDIDIIINRTLVYACLTALLALVYFGLIFAIQYLLRGITSQNNDVAIVVSTLAIAALFQPLRHRIQTIIDRRFYRRKYNAAKVVATFSSTLRQEVNLDQLRDNLLAVVQETMQPSHVSLWLRQHNSTETLTLPADKHPLDKTKSHQ
jgi:hypothetical protein